LRGIWGGGRGGGCIKTIRVEDGSLSELTDLLIEFSTYAGGLPHNTVVLLGSVSSMLHHGSNGYIFDWLSCAAKITTKWYTTKVCPLIPLPLETAPGQLSRTILEIGHVFAELFGSDPRSLADPWAALMNLVRDFSEKCPNIAAEKYTLPFPNSLVGPLSLKNYTFYTSHPCPAELPVLSCKAKSDLVRTLIDTLNRDFSAGIDPVVTSVRITDTMRTVGAKDITPPPPVLCS
jgi:hypothetical protein